MSTLIDPADPREGKVSASAFEIFAECPGMWQLKAALPPDAIVRSETDDDAAAFGTAVHLARQTGNTLPLTEEQTAVYQEGLKVEREIVSIWAAQFRIQTFHEGPREIRLWYHNEDMEPVASAQLDVHYISDDPPGHMLVIDWKALTCPHLTAAQRNWQGRVQVVCAQAEYECSAITWALCKPKVRWNQKEIVSYNADSIQHAKWSIDHAVWESQQPGAPRRPGGHCVHCPCKAACPEAGAYALLPSVVSQRALPDAEKIENAVDALTHEDLIILWRRKTLIEKILELSYARLKKLPDDTLTELGLERTNGRRMDPIANILGAVEYLRGKGWEYAEIFACMREDAFSKEKLAEKIALREQIAEKWALKRIGEEFSPFILPKNADPGLRFIKGI